MYLNEGWNIISAAAPELFVVRNNLLSVVYLCGI